MLFVCGGNFHQKFLLEENMCAGAQWEEDNEEQEEELGMEYVIWFSACFAPQTQYVVFC